MNLFLHGASGKMGQQVEKLFLERHPKAKLLKSTSSGVANPFSNTSVSLEEIFAKNHVDFDTLIDFSLPAGNLALLEASENNSQAIHNKAILICTTGLDTKILSRWQKLSEGAKILIAANTSLGILALAQIAQRLAATLPDQGFDVEIIETHHRHKKDAPSGTALYLFDQIKNARPSFSLRESNSQRVNVDSVAIHAQRAGGVFGEHELRFISEYEEVSISHRALSRDLFASGALDLVSKLADKPNDFYHIEDLYSC